MELLVLAGLILVICPFVGFFLVLGARSRLTTLETLVQRLQEEITFLHNRVRALQDASKTQEKIVTPVVTLVPNVVRTDEDTAVPRAPSYAPLATPVMAAQGEINQVPPELTAAPGMSAPVGEPVVATAPTLQMPASPQPSAPRSSRRATPPPRPAPAWVGQVKEWLFGGNLVAKVGLLILFIGVSFLLKYAAARVTVPIELRLAGITLADIGLLLWGWRIRSKRPAIGLPVQGAALAILMLVTFAAFKMYQLILPGAAFGLLFVLTAFTCLLAVLQNARWLAIFGIAGGFAAPILTSTGQGSHVALFSYYALLNSGILLIAWLRSWRLLNLVGFAFTFVIGTTWGVTRYLPEHYASAQGFLILFFVFYVAISVLFAYRQAPQLKNYVDGTLVFGTPMVAFGLQQALVKDMPFGLAFSALALGVFYMLLTLLLWKRRGSSLRLLVETFFALAIVFGTLAVPFALDGRWTSAAWALEGAGIVWIGLRQRQPLAWIFGIVVQVGAWFSFMASLFGLSAQVASQSNLWLGFLLLALTAFLMATHFRKHAQVGSDGGTRFAASMTPLATIFLALASIWLLAGAWTEIFLRSHGATRATLIVVCGMLVALLLGVIARRTAWPVARNFALLAQLFAAGLFLLLAIDQLGWPGGYHLHVNLLDGPFLGSLLLTLGAGFSAWHLQRHVQSPQANASAGLPLTAGAANGLLGWAGFWWFGFVLQSVAAWLAHRYQLWGNPLSESVNAVQVTPYYFWSSYALLLVLATPLWMWLTQRLQWTTLRWPGSAAWVALSIASVQMIGLLYLNTDFPDAEIWLAYGALWVCSEWLLRRWQQHGWTLAARWQKLLHAWRMVVPWLLLWPVGKYWVNRWLHVEQAEQLAQTGWFVAGSWARYLPVWIMLLVLGWLIKRVHAERWPVTPLQHWYRTVLIPLGAGWALVLAVIWNFTQNGLMSPLPYVPLLNPLDLTTGFTLLLGMLVWRMVAEDATWRWPLRFPIIAAFAAYGWFNLMLLRSVAHYGNIPYQMDTLFRSQSVQAMLSLVWSLTALVLMHRAAKTRARKIWMLGAALLAIVVAKLFFVDLSNVGGVERIVSFLGVGLLMVAIGYVAPLPTSITPATEQKREE